jgi:hypothetical protein
LIFDRHREQVPTYEESIGDTERALRRRIKAAHESFEPGSDQFIACLGTCYTELEGVGRNVAIAPVDEARLRALIERERP